MSVASCIAPHLRCLRAAGFYPAAATGGWARAHRLYRLLVLGFTSTYLLQECIYAYQIRRDIEELARVMFLLLCHVTSLVKQLVFSARAGRVEALVAALAAAGRGARGARDAALQERTRRRAARLQASFAGVATFTCTLWLLFPLVARLQHRRVRFPFWLPGDAHPPARFAAVLINQFYVTSLVGIANTTMDAFIATILYQCQTQLHILRLNFSSLLDRAEVIQQETKEDLEDITMRLLKECVHHYHSITETTNMLQDIFGLAILINFAIGGWILCMAVYKLVSINVVSIEFLSVLLFITCILLELFLYCYFGNEVTVESGMLVEALYACGWERGLRGRGRGRGAVARGVLLALVRAGRPLRLAALRLVPLSLQSFLKILKSSYTFYAVLNQTKDKI